MFVCWLVCLLTTLPLMSSSFLLFFSLVLGTSPLESLIQAISEKSENFALLPHGHMTMDRPANVAPYARATDVDCTEHICYFKSEKKTDGNRLLHKQGGQMKLTKMPKKCQKMAQNGHKITKFTK